MITSNDITVVFQGRIADGPENSAKFADFVTQTRRALPKAKIILSTWNDSALSQKQVPVDEIIRSEDPGHLPGIKFTDPAVNNINRQILSSRGGLEHVTTKYALKLRTDSFIIHTGFLDYIQKHFPDGLGHRLLTCTYYTLDPHMFERIPFHISDWMQFGETTSLRQLWDAPTMSIAEATYYETHTYPSYFNYFERQFRTQFAVEQHIWSSYAKKRGYDVPRIFVDRRKSVIQSYKRFIADELIILDPEQIGLEIPKHAEVKESLFQQVNCLNYLDWLLLHAKYSKNIKIDAKLRPEIFKRRLAKLKWLIVFPILSPIHRFIFRPELAKTRRIIKRMFFRSQD